MQNEIDKKIAAYQCRYNRLKANGKNLEGEGVLRKIQRKIRKLQATKEQEL